MKNKKEEIKLLAKELMFELSEDDVNSILYEYDDICHQLKTIADMQLDYVELTNFCIEFEPQTLREDNYIINDENVFSNCSIYNGKYVVIKDEK